MPALETSPPSQPKQLIWRKKYLLFIQAILIKTSLLHIFFKCNEEFSHFPQEDRGKKSKVVSQIEMGSIQGPMQNQAIQFHL